MVRVDKIMKTRLLIITLFLSMLISPIVALASDISNAQYYGTIIVSNNSTATTNVATTANISTTNLIDGNYINAGANNTALRNASGADVPFMPGYTPDGNPWAMWVPTIGANSYLSYILYTANSTGGDLNFFPDDGGMTTPDDATLELGANFTIEQKGWVQTTFNDNYSDRNLAHKGGAFKTWVSNTENIISGIAFSTETGYLDYVATNNDASSVPDHADFSFTDGAGNDDPFSILMRVRMDIASGALVNKFTSAGNLREWRFHRNANVIRIETNNFDDANKLVGRATGDISAFDGLWVHLAATYDGSETNGGFNIYLNGIDVDTSDIGAGAYTGMSDTNSKVEFGTRDAGDYYDGGMAEVKIYASEFTPSQVLSDYNGTHIAANLKGYWQIDEGVGLPQDTSGNGHHFDANTADWATGFDRIGVKVTATGVSSGEHTVSTTGRPVLHFDGINDKVVVPHDPSLAPTTAITIEEWFYCDDVTADDPHVTKHKAIVDRSFHVGTAFSKFGFLFSSDGAAWVADNRLDAVVNDTWYHGVVTWDAASTDWVIYLNGVAGSTGNWAGPLFASTVDLVMGTSGNEANWLTGDIGEVRIYNRALTPAEVTEHYNGVFTNETGLISYWSLHEGAGVVASDSEGTNDGNIVGATWGNETLRIYVDDTLRDVKDGASVPDSANNWTFIENYSMLYMESHEIEIDGVQAQFIEWEYDNVFNDQSVNDNDATPSFRSASSDPDVSAILSAFIPISEAQAPGYAIEEAPPFIDATGLTGNVTSDFTTTPGTGTGTFPLADIITTVATATSNPPQLPLLIIAVFVILTVSLSTSRTIRNYGSGSLIIKIVAIVAIMGIFVALGNFAIDFWMILVFLVIAIAATFASKQLGWT